MEKITLFNLLAKFPGENRSALIPILQAVQKRFGYISEESVFYISRHLKVSRSQIFGVATFYSQFKFNPPGEHSVKICLGTACHVLGGDFLLNSIKIETGISPGETTPDGKFDLDRVACLGCCALAPVVRLDNEIMGRMSVIKLQEQLRKYG